MIITVNLKITRTSTLHYHKMTLFKYVNTIKSCRNAYKIFKWIPMILNIFLKKEGFHNDTLF